MNISTFVQFSKRYAAQDVTIKQHIDRLLRGELDKPATTDNNLRNLGQFFEELAKVPDFTAQANHFKEKVISWRQ